MGMGPGWGWMCTHSVWHGSIIDIRGKGGGSGHVCGSTPWMALVLGFVVPCLIWNTSLLQRLGIKLSQDPHMSSSRLGILPFLSPSSLAARRKSTRQGQPPLAREPLHMKEKNANLLPCLAHHEKTHRKRQMVGGTKKSTRQTIHQPDPTVQLPARYSACPVSNSTAPNRNGKENLVCIVIFVVVTTTA